MRDTVSTRPTLGWSLILLGAALGLAIWLLSVTAHGEQATPHQQHVAFARAVLARVPVPKADREGERAELRAKQLDEFAQAIAEVSAKQRNPRQYAALLVTIGSHESNFDTQLVLGICAKWACDRGRAKGAFQGHSVSFTRDIWPTVDGSPRLQVEMADRALRRSLTRCAPFAPFPAHVFRAYKGGAAGSCSWALRDEAQRVATFTRLLAVKPGETR